MRKKIILFLSISITLGLFAYNYLSSHSFFLSKESENRSKKVAKIIFKDSLNLMWADSLDNMSPCFWYSNGTRYLYFFLCSYPVTDSFLVEKDIFQSTSSSPIISKSDSVFGVRNSSLYHVVEKYSERKKNYAWKVGIVSSKKGQKLLFNDSLCGFMFENSSFNLSINDDIVAKVQPGVKKGFVTCLLFLNKKELYVFIIGSRDKIENYLNIP